jgi:hypothetical protein
VHDAFDQQQGGLARLLVILGGVEDAAPQCQLADSEGLQVVG